MSRWKRRHARRRMSGEGNIRPRGCRAATSDASSHPTGEEGIGHRLSPCLIVRPGGRPCCLYRKVDARFPEPLKPLFSLYFSQCGRQGNPGFRISGKYPSGDPDGCIVSSDELVLDGPRALSVRTRAISGHCNDVSPFSNVVRLKPAPRLPERPVCTRFGACVMSVLFPRGGAFWTNTRFMLQTGSMTTRRPNPEFSNCRRRRRPSRTTHIASLPTTGCVARSPEFASCTSMTMSVGASPEGFSDASRTHVKRPPWAGANATASSNQSALFATIGNQLVLHFACRS